MHDGSIPTLRKVGEIDALVAFLEAVEGEGYHDTPPRRFHTVDRKSMSETDVARAN
jgi:hypothetical protein